MEGHEKIIKLFSAFNEYEIKEFLHSCMNEICGRKGPTHAAFRLHDQYSLEEFNEVVAGVKKLCSDCVTLDLDFEKVKECIPALTQNQYDVICECLTVRKHELMGFVAMDQISKCDKVLTDYDWKLKWVVGSSAFSAMHEPLLNLDLHLKSGNDNTTMNLELDKSELKLLIEALEKAQQSMFNR